MSDDVRNYTVDRTEWPHGPWDGEKDYYAFKTKVGLPAMVIRNFFGGLCGYVGVYQGHPFYEKDYNEVEFPPAHGEESDWHPHGGLTYSDHCQGHICHIPEPGEPGEPWWLGFDTSHAWDYNPGMYRNTPFPRIGVSVSNGAGETYKDVNFVKEECEALAAQLTLATLRRIIAPSG